MMTEAMTVAVTSAPAAPARPPLTVTWHAFDLKSGRRGPQLATQNKGTISRILSEATEHELTVLVWKDGAPYPGWEGGTTPGTSMLVALDEADQPVWGGMVYRRRRDAGIWATVSLVTLEAYFDRRYVADQDYSSTEQTLIAAGVIAGALTDGVEMTVDADSGIRFRDRAYFEDEDKTVLSVLGELAGIENGIEFTIDLQWTDASHTVLERVVRVAARIGTGTTKPTAVFAMPGSVIDFEYVEDYSADHGANAVQATSSGEGDTRPESRWWTAGPDTWARFERKITPSTSIINPATLDLHARAEVLQTWDGMKELTLTANAQAAPRVGDDWYLGDDVAVSLTCPTFPERLNADGARVPGYQAVVRAIGWELDLDAGVLKPRLLESDEVEVEEL